MSNASQEEQPSAADAPVEPVAIDVDRSGPEPCAEHELTARIEALLISTDRPLTDARLGALLGLLGKGVAKRVTAAIDELNGQYEATGRAFRIERLAGGWQVLTRPDFGELLTRLHRDRQQSRLSQPALETLSIIAYRQPIIRAEIESIRGVSCGEVLRGLLERRLVKIVCRAEELGRPMLYGTTREFLKVFGLSNLNDLPKIEGLKEGAKRPVAAGPSAEEEATEPQPEETAEEPTPAPEPAPSAESPQPPD